MTSSNIEFESDSFEPPFYTLNKNFDLELAMALSESMNVQESNILNTKEANKLFNFQMDLILLNEEQNFFINNK